MDYIHALTKSQHIRLQEHPFHDTAVVAAGFQEWRFSIDHPVDTGQIQGKLTKSNQHMYTTEDHERDMLQIA